MSDYQDDCHNSDTVIEPGTPADGTADRSLPAGLKSPSSERDKYTVSGEVARGGMGVILNACDTSIGREVAMKVITTGWSEFREYSERFVREAQIQGRLEHPNICPVHELGTNDDDSPYFTMKMVHGYSLADMIRETRERKGTSDAKLLTKILNIFLKICDGIAYAHSQGIIHRDLKPDNIMVGDFGEVYVMDWGLAKVMGADKDQWRSGLVINNQDGKTDTMKTMTGSVVGTPAYMPPEQSLGLVEEMDERSDIYSLGALLYELLSLEPPFIGDNPWDILAQISKVEPSPPSGHPQGRSISVELDSIVMKCLQKHKENRYQTVKELKHEIELFLSGRPIGAIQYNLWQVFAKWVARNKIMSFSLLAVLLVIVTAAAVAYVNMSRSWKNEQFARLKAEENARTTRAALSEAEVQRKVAEGQRRQAETSDLRSRINMAMMLEEKREIGEAVKQYRLIRDELLDKRLDIFPFVDLAIWRAQYNNGRSIRRQRVLNGENQASHQVAFSPGGRTLAVGCLDGTIQLWNWTTGGPPHRLERPNESVCSLAFSPDGKLLAAGYQDANLILWDVARCQVVVRLRDSSLSGGTAHATAVLCGEFSPDGTLLASTGDEVIKLWNVRERTIVSRMFGHTQVVDALAFAPDGKHLVSGGMDQNVNLWNMNSGQLKNILYHHQNDIQKLAFSPDGHMVVSASCDTTVRLWDVVENREAATLRGHETDVTALGISPDGTMLVTGGKDRTVRFWDMERRIPIAVFKEHDCPVSSVAFSPDGKTVASAGRGGRVIIWSLEKESMVETIDLSSSGYRVTSLAYNPDGSILAVGPWGNKLVPVLLLDPLTGTVLDDLMVMGGQTNSIKFSPDGTLLATGNRDGLLRIGDVGKRECLTMINVHEERHTTVLSLIMTSVKFMSKSADEIWKDVSEVAFSPDSRMIATACDDGIVKLWDVASTRMVHRFEGYSKGILTLDYSPDGRLLAAAGMEPLIFIWDVGSRKLLETFTEQVGNIGSVRFSPDSRLLATTGNDRNIRIWDVAARRCITVMKGHFASINEVNFSPDGHLLASGDEGSTVKVWDVARGECLLTLKEHSDDVEAVVFNSDGTVLATGSRDYTINLWQFGDALKPLEF